jgi:hypothetical protein
MLSVVETVGKARTGAEKTHEVPLLRWLVHDGIRASAEPIR